MFAWYSLVGTAGTALGQLICGWTLNWLQSIHGWGFVPSCRVVFFVYAAVGIIKLILALALSRKVEYVKEKEPRENEPQNDERRPLLANPAPAQQEAVATPKKSMFSSIERDLWSLVIRLFILFGLDSFASGLASL